ncbi:MAG: hypothetical protein ACI4OW_06690 [Alphaproteobacteria bacterium]
MTEVKKTPLVGSKSSPVTSNLSVFESFRNWKELRSTKVIPNGAYFVAGILDDASRKHVSDIHPNIFVQGYRPHSSDGFFARDRRRYGRLFVGFSMPEHPEYEDDLYLITGNLYRAVDENSFEMVMYDGEWLIRENVETLFANISSELDLPMLSQCKRFWLTPSKSCGYFLKGRRYPVLSLLVGKAVPMAGVQKQVLALDLNSGVPGLLDYYNPDDFERMPKERGAIIDDRFIVAGNNLQRK